MTELRKGFPGGHPIPRAAERAQGRGVGLENNQVLRPLNDDFANRAWLEGMELTVTGSNAGASSETGEPAHGGQEHGHSVWWGWRAALSGSVVVSTDGSDFDTVTSVYRGEALTALARVGSDHDGGLGSASRVRFDAVAGESYAIAITGYSEAQGGAEGRIVLNVRRGSPAAGQITSPASIPQVKFWKEGVVYAVVGQPDGHLLVGGDFTAIGGRSRRYLARLTPLGQLDPGWTPELDGPVTSMVVAGEDLFVAGRFTHVDGLRRNGLAKISLKDGGRAVSEWDALPGPGENLVQATGADPRTGLVTCMAVSGSDLVLGGWFGTMGGLERVSLAKVSLAGTGTPDAVWAPGLRCEDGASPVVWDLAVVADGVVLGGRFDQVNHRARDGVAKVALDGTGEVSTQWAPELEDMVGRAAVRHLEVREDQLWIGVDSEQAGWVAEVEAYGVGAVNPEGWHATGGPVTALAVVGNHLYAACGGTPAGMAAHLRRWSLDPEEPIADRWTTPITERPHYASDFGRADWERGAVRALASWQGQLVLGGEFRTINGQPRLGLGTVQFESGTAIPDWRIEVQRPGLVLAAARNPFGMTVVGGEFAMVDRLYRDNLARFERDGTLDRRWFPWVDGAVTALAADNEAVYVGGLFGNVRGLTQPCLAKIPLREGDLPDPAWRPDVALTPSIGTSNGPTVRALVLHQTNLFVAGTVTMAGGAVRGFGCLDTLAGRIESGPFRVEDGIPEILGMVLQSDGKLILGGTFRSVGGEPRPGLARIDGVSPFGLDPVWSEFGESNWQGNPIAFAIEGSHLYVGTDAGSVLRLQLSSDGSVDAGWPELDLFRGPRMESGGIRAMAMAGARLYVGGWFWPIGDTHQTAGNGVMTMLAQVEVESGKVGVVWQQGSPRDGDGQGGMAGSLNGVAALAASGDDVWVGGGFEEMAGAPRGGLALLAQPAAPVLHERGNWVFAVSRAPEDSFETTHFLFTEIAGGTVTLLEGGAVVKAGDFITVAQGEAGLVFTPDPNGSELPVVSAVSAVNGQVTGVGNQPGHLALLQGSPVPYFKLSKPVYTVRENGEIRVTVEKIGGGAGTVAYFTEDGTAVASRDYEPRQGTLSFASWETVKTIPVIRTGNDFVYRGDATFLVRLRDPTGGGGLTVPATATARIEDDDNVGPSDSVLERRLPNPLMPETNAALRVVFDPAAAPGQWRLTGELEWLRGEEIVTGLSRGNYRVELRPVPGFWVSSSRWISVLENQTNLLVVTLYAKPEGGRGAVRIYLEPELVASNGVEETRGAWRLAGDTAWHGSGHLLTNVPAGDHALEFRQVPGFQIPFQDRITVFSNQTVSATRSYVALATVTGLSPQPVSYEELTSTNWPFMFNGQIKTDLGFGSGVAVRERVVLTAAHVLFDDRNFRWANDVAWLHQKHRGIYQPPPQSPRGWYVFEGYAALRQQEQMPGSQSLAASTLDLAAMFFEALPTIDGIGFRTAAGGFVASNSGPQNEHIIGSPKLMLAGFPVAGSHVLFPGMMHKTDIPTDARMHLQDCIFFIQFVGFYGGGSGGPLYVLNDNGFYYPAAIAISGPYGVLVRAFDSSVAKLVLIAETTLGEGQVEAGTRVKFHDLGTSNDVFNSSSAIVDPLTTQGAEYRVKAPRLGYGGEGGIWVEGTGGTRYWIEFTESLEGGGAWVPVVEVILTNGPSVVPGIRLGRENRGFYRARWIPE